MAVAFSGMWKKGGVRVSLRDPGSVFLTLQEEMFGDGGYGERSRLEADAWMSLAFRGSPGSRMGREEGWGEGTLCPTSPLSGKPHVTLSLPLSCQGPCLPRAVGSY